MSTVKKGKTKEEILTIAIPLFANEGYSKLSMRQIAKAVGIKAGSLYHHFPSKQTLYIEALGLAFAKWAEVLSESFALDGEPKERIRKLVHDICKLMANDFDFSRLIQRAIMDGDEQQLKLLADNIFAEFFVNIKNLCHSFAPKQDPHLMAISIMSMAIYHFQVTPIRSFLPGSQKCHNDPEVIAQHICSLLETGLPL